MVFRQDIEPKCSYCLHGKPLDEEHMSCLRNGIVSCGYKCRHFTYDPLKRVPSRPVSIKILPDELFSLDD